MADRNFVRKKVKSLTLGEKLQQLREDRRLRVQDLSKKINVKGSYIIALEKGDYENAWSYAVDSAFYGNEPEYMIGLFLLQARILVKLYRVDESKILAELIGAIIKEKGWKNKQEYSRLLAYHNINIQNIKSAKSLFRKAKKFWVSERYEGLEQQKGKIIFIHPKGKVGKIKTKEGHVYDFHKRDFNRKQSYLPTLKNTEVVFVVINDIDNKQVAENIKVLKNNSAVLIFEASGILYTSLSLNKADTSGSCGCAVRGSLKNIIKSISPFATLAPIS